LKSKLNHVIA